jgi:hypothetical protein
MTTAMVVALVALALVESAHHHSSGPARRGAAERDREEASLTPSPRGSNRYNPRC